MTTIFMTLLLVGVTTLKIADGRVKRIRHRPQSNPQCAMLDIVQRVAHRRVNTLCLGMRAGRGRLAEVIALRGGQADPEAPFVIEHREALIDMLCEAAELEHGIMCQYLFAAFSLREREDEGLTASEQNIKPLFRERDRESTKFAFDPADQVAAFRQWVESGKA